MIAGNQHAVGGGAIEKFPAGGDRGGTVDVEACLPIRMAREHRRMLGGVAQDQQGLIAGMNGKDRVARRVTRRGNGGVEDVARW